MSDRHGYYEATPHSHRCNAWDCDPCTTRPPDSPLKCRPESTTTARKKRLGHPGVVIRLYNIYLKTKTGKRNSKKEGIIKS